MHVLALVNQKGGCGKTTTAVNLAAALAAQEARVLLVDLDPQAHATLAAGAAVEREPSVLSVLAGQAPVRAAARPVPGGFDLVPSCARLTEIEERAERTLEPERALARALADERGRYDHVVLDCPPRADGVLSANALRAADTAVLVVECGAFALQGAVAALPLLAHVAEGMRSPFAVRALAALFERDSSISREVLIALQARFGELLFDTIVHRSERLREAAAFGVPVRLLDPASRSASDFASLASEVAALAARRTPRAVPAPAPPPARTRQPLTLVSPPWTP